MPCPFMYTAKRDSYYSKEPWTLAGGKGGTNFALDSYEKFRLAFQDKKKKGKDPGDEFWYEIRERKQQGETPNL